MSNPFSKKNSEVADAMGIPSVLIDVISHFREVRTTFNMFTDIHSPKKRHAYRILLNCLDMLYDDAVEYTEDLIVKSSRDLCVRHLINNPELSGEAKTRLQTQAFYE